MNIVERRFYRVLKYRLGNDENMNRKKKKTLPDGVKIAREPLTNNMNEIWKICR